MIARSLQQWAKSSPYDFIGTGALAALTILFAVGVLEPLSARRQAAALRRQDAVRQQQKANALSAEVQSLTGQIDFLHRSLEASKLRLQPTAALNERLAALVALSNRHHLDVQKIQPAAAQPQPKYVAVPIHMTGRASFPVCVAFMSDLPKELPDLGISDFSIRASADDPAGCDFEFSLTWLAAATTPQSAVHREIATVSGE